MAFYYCLDSDYCLAFDNCLDSSASRTYQHPGTMVRNFRVYILQPYYHYSVVQHLLEWMFRDDNLFYAVGPSLNLPGDCPLNILAGSSTYSHELYLEPTHYRKWLDTTPANRFDNLRIRKCLDLCQWQ